MSINKYVLHSCAVREYGLGRWKARKCVYVMYKWRGCKAHLYVRGCMLVGWVWVLVQVYDRGRVFLRCSYGCVRLCVGDVRIYTYFRYYFFFWVCCGYWWSRFRTGWWVCLPWVVIRVYGSFYACVLVFLCSYFGGLYEDEKVFWVSWGDMWVSALIYIFVVFVTVVYFWVCVCCFGVYVCFLLFFPFLVVYMYSYVWARFGFIYTRMISY